LRQDFQTVSAARAAEDFIVEQAVKAGLISKDHGEFIVGITFTNLKQLFSEAVEIGDADEEDPKVR
jgi:hypothetical protein